MPDPRSARIAALVERWFSRNLRSLPWRERYVPYEVWISEVMAQQTRIEVVSAYFTRFVARFPDVASLAAAGDDEVTALWSGLGYYRRARHLRQAAEVMMERFGGRVPRRVEELLTLPGVGRYTAGAIASIAYGVRTPAVDGNVERIVARLEGTEDVWRQAAVLVGASRSARRFNQGLMEIGALICRPRNPGCVRCPLRGECVAFRDDRVDELPSRKKRKPPTEVAVALFVVRDRRGRVLLRRDAAGALMAGLFHLPHSDTALLPLSPLAVDRLESLGHFTHTITTRRVRFEVVRATLRDRLPTADRIADGSPEYLWIDPDQLHAVPHPSYVEKALELLET